MGLILLLVASVDACAVVLSYLLLRRCEPRAGVVPGFAFFPFLITMYPALVGSSLVVVGAAQGYYAAPMLFADANLNWTVWRVCVYCVIMCSAAMAFVAWLSGGALRAPKLLQWIGTDVRRVDVATPLSEVILLVLVLIFFAAATYIFRSLGQVPLLRWAQANPTEIAFLRARAKYSGYLNTYIVGFGGILLGPFVSLLMFERAAGTQSARRFHWLLWLGTVLVTAAVLTYDYEKFPLVLYVLQYYMLLRVTGTRPVVLRSGKWLLVVAAVVAFGASTLSFRYSSWDQAMSINGPLGRVFIGQIAAMYAHFQIFPSQIPFLAGKHFPGFVAAALGNDAVRSSRLVALAVTGGSSTAGFYNSIFPAEAYANWGWSGVIVAPLVAGVVYEAVYVFALSRRRSAYSAVFTVLLLTTVAGAFSGGFYDFLYNPNALVLAFLYFVLQWSSQPSLRLHETDTCSSGNGPNRLAAEHARRTS